MIPPAINPLSGLPYGCRLEGSMETPSGVFLHFTDVGGTGSTFTVRAEDASPQTILDALLDLRGRFTAPVMDLGSLIFDVATAGQR